MIIQKTQILLKYFKNKLEEETQNNSKDNSNYLLNFNFRINKKNYLNISFLLETFYIFSIDLIREFPKKQYLDAINLFAPKALGKFLKISKLQKNIEKASFLSEILFENNMTEYKFAKEFLKYDFDEIFLKFLRNSSDFEFHINSLKYCVYLGDKKEKSFIKILYFIEEKSLEIKGYNNEKRMSNFNDIFNNMTRIKMKIPEFLEIFYYIKFLKILKNLLPYFVIFLNYSLKI